MIHAQNLTRRFGAFTAVSQVDLQVPDGSILALLGPNGAGKTTTVRMLAGLLAPSEGEATVAGFDVRRDPDAVRACVGLVTDAPGLFEQMKVPAYLDFFGSIYGIPPAERSRRIDELLEFFELSAHRDQKMAGFSKGMKQKVALARALIHEPQVLFLDEPTSGLDPLAARAVRELIVRLKHSSRSIILCTHDLDEAERLADQVAILRQGRIVACDTPAALRRQATGETRVQVELVIEPSRALERLEMISGIHSPRFIQNDIPAESGQPSMNGNSHTKRQDVPASGDFRILEYYTAQPRTVNPQVVAQLVDAGAQIVSIVCESRTLEDVYASAMGNDVEQTDNRMVIDETGVGTLVQQEN
ncbi:MAG TPA: ABC transporter ATP-binding protein [Ktedonobacteraceae bacterium]|nr:ABC transporter ATP-binding protein [Ktedonobacteraceae bacterium]